MLALIPARGGAKGLPGKTIRLFAGLPLIAHTIQAARVAVSITRVVVSTDDEEIATIARTQGAEVPFLRPPALAGDASPAIATELPACTTLEGLGSPRIEELVVLLPTSPLRMAPDIDQAVGQFHLRNADAVISVTPSGHPLHWAKVVDDQGVLRDALPGGPENNRNRQDYAQTFLPNGAIYVFRRALLERRAGYYSERTYPMVMPKHRSIDIDDRYDFAIAEFLLTGGPRPDHPPGPGP